MGQCFSTAPRVWAGTQRGCVHQCSAQQREQHAMRDQVSSSPGQNPSASWLCASLLRHRAPLLNCRQVPAGQQMSRLTKPSSGLATCHLVTHVPPWASCFPLSQVIHSQLPTHVATGRHRQIELHTGRAAHTHPPGHVHTHACTHMHVAHSGPTSSL